MCISACQHLAEVYEPQRLLNGLYFYQDRVYISPLNKDASKCIFWMDPPVEWPAYVKGNREANLIAVHVLFIRLYGLN